MKATVPKFLIWLPWMALLVLAGVCIYLLAQELLIVSTPPISIFVSFTGALIVFLLLALALESVEQEVQLGQMEGWLRRLLFWTPRVVALLFAAFLSLFALDVFGQGASWWETLLALLIHLIPVFVLLGGITLAWRWEWVGALILGGWAIFYVASAWGSFGFSVYLTVAVLPFVLGMLFLLNWLYRAEVRVR